MWQTLSHFPKGKEVLQPNGAFCLPKRHSWLCGNWETPWYHTRFTLMQLLTVLLTLILPPYLCSLARLSSLPCYEYGVPPTVFWCFFCGRVHYKYISLNEETWMFQGFWPLLIVVFKTNNKIPQKRSFSCLKVVCLKKEVFSLPKRLANWQPSAFILFHRCTGHARSFVLQMMLWDLCFHVGWNSRYCSHCSLCIHSGLSYCKNQLEFYIILFPNGVLLPVHLFPPCLRRWWKNT